MKQRLLVLLAILFVNCHAVAQGYYREDSVLTDMVNNFVRNTMMQYANGKPIDSNELEYLGIMAVFINGGAMDKGNFHFHTDGLLRKEGESEAATRERQVQDAFLKEYMDKIKVTSVDDLIKLMKQTSWNKDKPYSPPEKQPAPMGKP